MFEILLQVAITLMVVINPFGTLPVFCGLTTLDSPQTRRRIATKATITSAVILICFALIGDFLLDRLHINQSSFRIMGGILLLLAAVDMVVARHSGISSTTRAEEAEANHRDDISVFPLAIPLIAGPGSMTSITIIMRQYDGEWLLQAGIILCLILVLLLNYIVLLFSGPISKVLGVTGSNVLTRVFGIILAALAVQFVVDGIRATFGI
jgi:multiple antibiotic resistance protein